MRLIQETPPRTLILVFVAVLWTAATAQNQPTPPDRENGQAAVSSGAGNVADDIYWSPLGLGMNGAVLDMTAFDGRLVAGGNFTMAGGMAAGYIAAWDGAAWTPLGLGMNGKVSVLAVYAGRLVAGGSFTSAGGISANRIAVWDGVSWSALGSGMDDEVWALAVYDGTLIAGGKFTAAGGIPVGHIAAWDGGSWAPLGSGADNWIQGVCVSENKLIVAGWFSSSGGITTNGISSWDGSTWSELGSGLGGIPAPHGISPLVMNNELFVGGSFATAGGMNADNIASWDGAGWSPLTTGTDGSVSALANYYNTLVAGGYFTTAGDMTVSNIAAWDGASWASLGSGTDGPVWAMAMYDGKLIVGGLFTTAGSTATNYIACWDNPGAYTSTFTRITSGPIWDDVDCSHGLHWVDYNNDGYLDLYITHWFVDYDHANALYANDGNGGFTKVTTGDIVTDVQSISGSWADYDNDGDLDGFVGHSNFNPTSLGNYMYSNNGDGTFAKLTTGSVVTDTGHSSSALWFDFDNDGDVDLFAANHCWSPCSGGTGLLCYRNDGDSLARIDNASLGLPTTGDNAYPSACDFDADGDMDLVYRRDEKRNRVFRNQGNGTFVEDAAIAFAADSSIGFSWADFDNDGDFDLLTTAVTTSRIYVNNSGVFSRIPIGAYNPGSGPWLSAAWGDCDNDGDQDLVIASMQGLYEPRANAFFINDGDGTFTRETSGPIATDLETSIGAGWADYDRDGDLDLLIVNNNYQHNALYENAGNNNSWITINCVGTISNRSGIGAEISVVATINGRRVRQLQQIASQSGAYAQMPLEAHFGLGDATVIDSVIVDWPSGITNYRLDVSINQDLTVMELAPFVCGDANGDGTVNVGDAVFLISYVFKGGSAPDPIEAGDANCDGGTNVGDAVYVINFVFKGGQEPCCP